MLPRRPISTLFPYTTLFRSRRSPAPGTLRLKARDTAAVSAQKGSAARVMRFERGWKRSLPCNVTITGPRRAASAGRSEEHTSELQSHVNLVCRLLLEKKKKL